MIEIDIRSGSIIKSQGKLLQTGFGNSSIVPGGTSINFLGYLDMYLKLNSDYQNQVTNVAFTYNAIKADKAEILARVIDVETTTLAKYDITAGDMDALNASVVAQFGAANGASWYGLTVQAGNVISGIELGAIDSKNGSSGSSYFAIASDKFMVVASYDLADADDSYLASDTSYPDFGTMWSITDGVVTPLPAFTISTILDPVTGSRKSADGSYLGYDIAFNGKVTFTNVTGTESLLGDIAASKKELSDIASDSIVTPSEKTIVAREWSDLANQYAELSARAATFSVSSVALTDAYNALYSYLYNLPTDTPVGISVFTDMFSNTTIDRVIWGTFWSAYYIEATKLDTATDSKAKTLADTAQASANTALSNNSQLVTDVNKIMDDSFVTPEESRAFGVMVKTIDGEYQKVLDAVAEANLYDMDTSVDIDPVGYTNAYNSLRTLLIYTPFAASVSATGTVGSGYAVSTTERSTLEAYLTDYNLQEKAIWKEITTKTKITLNNVALWGNSSNYTEINGNIITTGTIFADRITSKGIANSFDLSATLNAGPNSDCNIYGGVIKGALLDILSPTVGVADGTSDSYLFRVGDTGNVLPAGGSIAVFKAYSGSGVNAIYAKSGTTSTATIKSTNDTAGGYVFSGHSSTALTSWIRDDGTFWSATTSYSFTAGHYGLISVLPEQGDIVADSGIVYKKDFLNGIGELVTTTTAMDTSVYGVYNEEIVDDYVQSIATAQSLIAIGTSSVGEGYINVCNENGNIIAGDFICSSNTAGKGMLQADDLMHNYTVAKAREAVDFVAEGITQKQIACVYNCG